MPDDKRKINAWIPVSLYDKIEPAGYENTTQAIITALQRLLEDPKEDITGYKQDIEGYRKDLERIQKDIEKQNQDISGYTQDIKALNNEIERLKEDISRAPDLVEFVQLQARYEGLQEIIRQKDEMIYILKQTNETLNTFAHYFKSMEVKQLQGSTEEVRTAQKEAQPFDYVVHVDSSAKKEKPDIKPVSKPEVKQGEKGQIEKICKYCEKPFYTDNIQKEYCSKAHKDAAYNEKRRIERKQASTEERKNTDRKDM